VPMATSTPSGALIVMTTMSPRSLSQRALELVQPARLENPEPPAGNTNPPAYARPPFRESRRVFAGRWFGLEPRHSRRERRRGRRPPAHLHRAVHTATLETNGVVTMFREDEPGYYHPAEPGGLRIGKRRRGAG